MAKVNPTEKVVDSRSGKRSRIIEWAGVKAGDECGAYDFLATDSEPHGFQMSGKFSGGACEIEGSINGEFALLRDGGGASLRGSQPGLGSLPGGVRMVRPVVSGGDDTAITISILARGIP